MDLGLLGIYWYQRALTLRGYYDFVRAVLEILRATHPTFYDLQWVGDGKRKPEIVAADMSNLAELVYKRSWGQKKAVRGERNSNGTPTWEAMNVIGFDMVFNTGASSKQGGITMSVHAGYGGVITPNVITISFPAPVRAEFIFHEFYDYDFLLDLFVKISRLALPDNGIVTSHEFSTRIYGDGPFDIGWLTYCADKRCTALAKEFATEKTDLQGTLFSLGKDRMFAKSAETVLLGQRLRQALKETEVLP